MKVWIDSIYFFLIVKSKYLTNIPNIIIKTVVKN